MVWNFFLNHYKYCFLPSSYHEPNMVKPISQVNIKFTVRRCPPELVAPAKPTPLEVMLLSDIDDQEALRFQIPMAHFYSYNPSMKGEIGRAHV